MYFKTFLFIALLTTTFTLARTQEPDHKIWNWAWRQDTGELFSYASSGETITILDQGVSGIYDVWRLNDEQAIGLIQVSGQTTFYRINSHFIQPLTLNFDMHDLKVPFDSRYGYRLEDYSPPFMLFTPSVAQNSPPSESAILINLDTNLIELLSNQVRWTSDGSCCRFTENGQHLRYMVITDDKEPQALELRERVFANNNERVIFTLPSDSFISSDSFGENWLVLDQIVATTSRVYNLYDSTGNINQIYKQSPLETYATYDFLNDELFSYHPLCETDCIVELTISSGEKLIFELPPAIGGASLWPAGRFGNRLIIGRLDGYWSLSTDHKPELIGHYFSAGSHLPPALSPDSRWLMLADSSNYPPQNIMVWDLLIEQIVINIPFVSPETVFQMVYDTDGFIMQASHNEDSVMYRFKDQAVVNLPSRGYGKYFEILPGGSLLYSATGTPELVAGIYKYDPEDRVFTLILKDVQYISTLDVNYDSFPL